MNDGSPRSMKMGFLVFGSSSSRIPFSWERGVRRKALSLLANASRWGSRAPAMKGDHAPQLGEFHGLSRRHCFFEDDGRSAWLYLTGPAADSATSAPIAADAFVFNHGDRVDPASVAGYCEEQPPICVGFASSAAVLRGTCRVRLVDPVVGGRGVGGGATAAADPCRGNDAPSVTPCSSWRLGPRVFGKMQSRREEGRPPPGSRQKGAR